MKLTIILNFCLKACTTHKTTDIDDLLNT